MKKPYADSYDEMEYEQNAEVICSSDIPAVQDKRKARIARRRAGILKVRVFCQDDNRYTVLAGYNFNSCDVLYHGPDLDYAIKVARDYISDSVNMVGCNIESYNQRILLHIDM